MGAEEVVGEWQVSGGEKRGVPGRTKGRWVQLHDADFYLNNFVKLSFALFLII